MTFRSRGKNGHALVVEVLEDLDEGVPIRLENAKVLRDALAVFVDHDPGQQKGQRRRVVDDCLQIFAKKMGLRGKQGRHNSAGFEAVMKRVAIVKEVLVREKNLLAQGLDEATARSAATREVAASIHKSIRHIQNLIKENLSVAKHGFGTWGILKLDEIVGGNGAPSSRKQRHREKTRAEKTK